MSLRKWHFAAPFEGLSSKIAQKSDTLQINANNNGKYYFVSSFKDTLKGTYSFMSLKRRVQSTAFTAAQLAAQNRFKQALVNLRAVLANETQRMVLVNEFKADKGRLNGRQYANLWGYGFAREYNALN